MDAAIVPLDRAARRRREREEAKAQEKAAKAAPEAPSVPSLAGEVEAGRLDIQDLHTVLLGAAGWSVGHPPFPLGEQRVNFRAACDRVATFLDLTLGWPEDPPAAGLDTPPPSRLILPGR